MARDQKVPCLAIYFDIQNTFDTVPDDFLLTKLATVGLDLNLPTLICSTLEIFQVDMYFSNSKHAFLGASVPFYPMI